jgi:hypothetical protein
VTLKGEAEGSAVQRTFPGNVFRQRSHGGLRPTQGDEKRLGHRSLSHRYPFLVIPTEAERRDLRFRGPFLEMFFDLAEWRDLLFSSQFPIELDCH